MTDTGSPCSGPSGALLITSRSASDGIGVYSSPADYRAVHHLQLSKFDGTTLVPIGKPSLLDDSG